MPKCALPDCESDRAKREWCNKHYLRWRKYGDPTYLLPRHAACTVAGCARAPRSALRGVCEMHYYRDRRHGSPLITVNTRQPVCKYRSAHARVAQDRGRARDHRCVDCAAQAQHWSYDHTDPAELTSESGQPYSLNVMLYDPRCAACHATFDGTGANQYSA